MSAPRAASEAATRGKLRVFVTGASGFVGQWLVRELQRAGHVVIPSPESLDVTHADDLARAVEQARPDTVVHLAAVAFGPDATAEPEHAVRVNVGGTVHVMEAVRRLAIPPVVLVTGSSEVYGTPHPDDLPLTEDSPLRPQHAYALSKAAQEGVALGYAARHRLRVVVTRPFNHIGPGQRPVFVVPAMARRVLAARLGEIDTIPAGNLDVARDFTDVRDVVRAYRLLLERMADGTVGPGGRVLNVCSGRSVSIRTVVTELCRLAGIEAEARSHADLRREGDPAEIRGDASALREVTGWQPEIPFETTLRDVWDETKAGSRAPSEPRC